MAVTVVTQEAFDAFRAPSMAVAKKMSMQRPSNPQHRTSATIQAEIDRNLEPLQRFTRELSEKTDRREKIVEAIGSIEGRIDAMRAAGVPSNHQNLQKLTGFRFSNKAGDIVYKDGILQQLQSELVILDRKIKQLTEAVPNQKAYCDAVIPTLQAELAEAKNWEKLTA
jgi:hypothetical protein